MNLERFQFKVFTYCIVQFQIERNMHSATNFGKKFLYYARIFYVQIICK